MSTIEDFMQKHPGERLEGGTRWLVWDSFENEWIVRDQAYRKRSLVVYQGISLPEALMVLEAGIS